MCQVSSSYSLLLRCQCLRVMHLISCHHVHCICIHLRLMHPSIFPVVHFAIQRSYVIRCPFLPFFRVWGLNIFRLDRDLPSGLGTPPVDRLSNFVSFGASNNLQMERNLTGGLPVVYQGHLASLGPFRESSTPTHNERRKGNAGWHRSAGSQNGQRGKCSDA